MGQFGAQMGQLGAKMGQLGGSNGLLLLLLLAHDGAFVAECPKLERLGVNPLFAGRKSTGAGGSCRQQTPRGVDLSCLQHFRNYGGGSGGGLRSGGGRGGRRGRGG